MMMKAQLIQRCGDIGEFYTDKVPIPSPKDGQVLIQVKASSVNPIDLKIRSGQVTGIISSFPTVLHSDIAGTIAEVGKNVTGFQVDDEVIASDVVHFGALADYVVVDACLVAKKPKNLTFAEAASLPLVSITAWEALFDRIKLNHSQHILIHGAAGGVGHIAIQLAKYKGAKVSTTVSTEEKAEIAQRLGADQIIYYPKTTVAEYVEELTDGVGFDVVLDTVGGKNLDRSLKAVKINGSVGTIAARSTHDLSPLHNKAITLHGIFMMATQKSPEGKTYHGVILKNISQLVEQGKITPLIDAKRFSFEQVGEAHQHLASGKAIGKVVLTND